MEDDSGIEKFGKWTCLKTRIIMNSRLVHVRGQRRSLQPELNQALGVTTPDP